MKAKLFINLLAATIAVVCQAQAQSPKVTPVPVTVDNFIRAESDLYAANLEKTSGLGKLEHRREPASIDNQTVIRLNRDTLYSSGVFDLDAGPVTITLPNAGKRFMSLQAVSEDHYARTFYGSEPRTFTRENVGTRYLVAGIRTLVDPADPEDLRKVHALQDAIKVSQKNRGEFQLPEWDAVSQKKVREALLSLASTLPDFSRAFGTKEQVDPIRHLIGTAAGWGGNADKDATYLNVTPTGNDAPSSTSLASKTCRSTRSGRSASTTRPGILRRTRRTATRSTVSPQRKATTARSRSSSATAMERSRTASRS